MIKAFLVIITVIAFVAVEVLLAQWLLGLFGWNFGFWTVFGILIVIDILIGGRRK